MSKKITVAEWIDYLKWTDTNWSKDTYVDDTCIEVNGVELSQDLDFDLITYEAMDQPAIVNIIAGSMYSKSNGEWCKDIITDFNQWRKQNKLDIRKELRKALDTIDWEGWTGKDEVVDVLVKKFNITKK